MAQRTFQVAATSKTVYVRGLDTTTFIGKTGLAYNTSGLVASYAKSGGARGAITLATQTAAGAWSSGGFVEVDATNCPGLYRLDISDVTISTGIFTTILLTHTSTIFEPVYIDLTTYDPLAEGPTVSTIAEATRDVDNSTPAGGSMGAALNTIDDFLDTEVAAIKAKTDLIPSDPADASDIAASLSTLSTKIDTVDDFLDTEIAAIKAKTDNLPAAPAAVADIPTAAAVRTEIDSNSTQLAATITKLDTLLTSDLVYKKNTAVTAFGFYMALTNGSPGTSLTVTVQLSKDGGAFATVAGTPAEISDGYYKVNLTNTEMNADEILFKATATGASQRNMKIRTQS